MTVTATETEPQVNGDHSAYESKFLPKVTSIPVISSAKKHLYAAIPQTEVLTNYVGSCLGTAFTYTNDTPIQGILIKLDTLAASGVEKLEKEVPAVNMPTDQVLKKTKVDKFLDILTHYYVASVQFTFNLLNAYKSAADPVIHSVLNRIETFLGLKPAEQTNDTERIKRIRGSVYEKVDSRVTPIYNKSRDTVTSVYNDKFVPLTQYPTKQFHVQKDKANEKYSPLVSELTNRYTKAESAAKDAWLQTKPDISGPNSVVPTLKSGIFTAITFGYNIVYPEQKKPDPKGVESQTNGLVSGVELTDGEAKKRSNGSAS